MMVVPSPCGGGAGASGSSAMPPPGASAQPGEPARLEPARLPGPLSGEGCRCGPDHAAAPARGLRGAGRSGSVPGMPGAVARAGGS